MFILILTIYDDDYKNRNDNIIHKRFKSKNKAEIKVIDLIYEYLDEYYAGDNENLKQRECYTMYNINELLSMIKTTYVKHKFQFSINEI